MRIRSRNSAAGLMFATLYIFFSYRKQKQNLASNIGTIIGAGDPPKDFLSFWHKRGSQKNAIIADENTIWKIGRLKNFQSFTHSLLMSCKLKIPTKLPEVESFMKKAKLQPEYWKTTIPSIFDPYG